MADILTATQRSERMRRIRSANTEPEIFIRRILHRMGLRFRLHVKDLPGRPDIVLRSKKQIIFVNGCFWHFHRNCRDGKIPASRISYWKPKLIQNRARDRKHVIRLKREGWKVLVIWECEIQNDVWLYQKLSVFLGGARKPRNCVVDATRAFLRRRSSPGQL